MAEDLLVTRVRSQTIPGIEGRSLNSARTNHFIVDDPAKFFPKEPLSAQLQVDAGFRQARLDLRQMLLTLTPTTRAKNVLDLKGWVDFAKTNTARSELTLRADSLDATRYFELFAGSQKTNAEDGTLEERQETQGVFQEWLHIGPQDGKQNKDAQQTINDTGNRRQKFDKQVQHLPQPLGREFG